MTGELYFDAAPVLKQIDRLFSNASQAAHNLPVHRETISRWRAGSRLQAGRADEIATALGFHPTELWPDWDDRHDEHERQLEQARANARAIKNAARARRRAQARSATT